MAARTALDAGSWSDWTRARRVAVIRRFGELHAVRSRELAEVITAESGAPMGVVAGQLASLREQLEAWVGSTDPNSLVAAGVSGAAHAALVSAPTGVLAA